MTNIVSSRIKCLEERISESRRDLSEMQLLEFHKNFVETCYTQFQGKDNEKQYKLNEQILECLRDAEEYLNDVVNRISSLKADNALKSLVQGINLLLYKQTLIKIADNVENDKKCITIDSKEPSDTGYEGVNDEEAIGVNTTKGRRRRIRRFAISTSTQADVGDKGVEAATEHRSEQV